MYHLLIRNKSQEQTKDAHAVMEHNLTVTCAKKLLPYMQEKRQTEKSD